MINKVDSEVTKRLQLIHNSYSGVTGDNYNAIFKIKVYDGVVTEDEYGNYKPSESEVIEIKAKVISTSPDSSIKDLNLDIVRDYYRVWFVSSLTYNLEIPQTLECSVLINGLWLEGNFNVVRNNISNLNENSKIRNSLGYAIEGTFEQYTNQRG